MDRTSYLSSVGYDEMFDVEGRPRADNGAFVRKLDSFSQTELLRRQKAAEKIHLRCFAFQNMNNIEASKMRIFEIFKFFAKHDRAR